MTHRVFNFSAGPSTLPLEVLEEARDEFVDYRGTGMSIIEMSHRSRHYDEVHSEALALAREVFQAPDDFNVLVVQGGATLQFSMVPMNLLSDGSRAAYANTGSWAAKALTDARHYGDAYRAWDGTATGHTRVPAADELELRPGTRYLHLTSNETIEGLRYPSFPRVDVPLVADMSSDYGTRPLPWDRFDLVYGGVQKNLGPAGMALVFIRTSALDTAGEHQGAYLRYITHAKRESLYNTPPVFSVYLTGKVLRWIRALGGLEAMARAADRKAAALYEVIDASEGFYRCPVARPSRSLTNVVFRLPDETLETRFLKDAAEEAGFVGLKGHRSVGGCRASLYNALPQAAAEALAGFMRRFQDEAG